MSVAALAATVVDHDKEMARALSAICAAQRLMVKAGECVDKITAEAQSIAENRECGAAAEPAYRRCLALQTRVDMAAYELGAIERLLEPEA